MVELKISELAAQYSTYLSHAFSYPIVIRNSLIRPHTVSLSDSLACLSPGNFPYCFGPSGSEGVRVLRYSLSLMPAGTGILTEYSAPRSIVTSTISYYSQLLGRFLVSNSACLTQFSPSVNSFEHNTACSDIFSRAFWLLGPHWA
jgi:hypothetical protein